MPRYKKFVPLVAIASIILVFLSACSYGMSENGPQMDRAPLPHSNKETDVSSKPNSTENEPKETTTYNGDLELPIVGATGYASVRLGLKSSPSADSSTIETLEPGTAFEILSEEGEWLFVKRSESTGWIPHRYAFINLPDVIPSIIYDNTNTYSSKFVSSGKAIPNISNQALYSGKTYNHRLEKEEYIMPVLYSMSKKIYKAQQHAMSEGNSIKLYEAFRPYSVQKAVVAGLTGLAQSDAEVMKGINTPPWGITWFITNGVSNHQMGYAIDISLVKVDSKKETSIGGFTVNTITEYTEYTMPSPIHELSGASAVFTAAVTSRNATAWKGATYRDTMNEAAINLQKYATTAGLTPLASEWWHFNDLDARDQTADNPSNGDYILSEVLSSSPMVE